MAIRQSLIAGTPPTKIAKELPLEPEALAHAEEFIHRWTEDGHPPTTWLDEAYPTQLRDVHDFPPVVFMSGVHVPEDFGVCVVGSRDADPATLDLAREISMRLAESEITVVSGLAQGVDTVAHQTALSQNARTVAVIGTGIDIAYPKQNESLQDVIKARGLVLSQFWPGSSPTKVSFPMRNAVMSAYAQATIIVGASESSGTRHQAAQAVAHGRPLVLMRKVASETSWGRKLTDDPAALVAVAETPVEAAEMAYGLSDRLLVPQLT
ncbi:DNA-protecting protein DprA [Pseudoclavibacter alba]|uniref:DNA-processing protein DprA n=1 Tax=Pseudoclavibacter albus TaxID=272241 RepID=UPI0019D1AD61|nr:DNA-processing protein DprA [Pseudoclavibacter alba]MBN6778876.1 DNA-protecting protein DprA [Pseudoclavibacter alba]